MRIPLLLIALSFAPTANAQSVDTLIVTKNSGEVVKLPIESIKKITFDIPLTIPDQSAHSTRVTPFPNPSDERVTFSLDLPESQTVQLSISDVAGKPIHSVVRRCAPGPNQIVWDGNLSNGVPAPDGSYTFSVSVGSQVSSGQFIKERK